MERTGGTSAIRAFLKGEWTEHIIDLVLVPLLLLYSLWLPPASVGARFFHADYPLVTPDKGGMLVSADGASLSIPAGAVEKRSRALLKALSADDLALSAPGAAGRYSAAVASVSQTGLSPDSAEYLALQRFPTDMMPYLPFYQLDVQGEAPANGVLTLPVPYELGVPALADLYGYDGESWQWLPSTKSEDGLTLTAKLDSVPQMLATAQKRASSQALVLSVSSKVQGQYSREELPVVSSVVVDGLVISDGGTLAGEPATADCMALAAETQLFLGVSDVVDGVVRCDLVDNMLIDDDALNTNLDAIVRRAARYDGVQLEYWNVEPALRDEFSGFVTRLADALQSSGKQLAVRIDTPKRSGMGWDTGAYDLDVIGAVADAVLVPALVDPAAYGEGGDMDDLMAWVTERVQRDKAGLLVSANAREIVDGAGRPISYADALATVVPSVSVDDSDGMLLPGEALHLEVPGVAALVPEFDPEAQVYSYTYTDDGGVAHTVYLENASSVARKVQYAARYGLGGVSVKAALSPENDGGVVETLASYQESMVGIDMAEAVGADMAVEDAESRLTFVWSVIDEEGNVVAREVEPLVDPNWTWTAPNNPGNYIIRAAVSGDGGSSDLNTVSELGVQVPTPTFTPTPLPTNTPTPTLTPTEAPTNTPTPKPTAKPQAASASRASSNVGGYFGYGVQAAMVSDGDLGRIMGHVTGMGFGWVKQQVEWFRYNPAPGQYDWGALDRIVDAANAAGVNVLFSVVKAPTWARPAGDTDQGPPSDPNTYGTFMKEMAARYKGRVKAYEIWNEQNLYYEWGGRGGKLNAGKYVELLKAAYNAVKSVDPGAVVVSGALTPTGVNDGDVAIDDRAYLEQMYQAGLARYCDAVGAHPSGYNNPPDADWQTWSDASAPSFKGHPSFFFRGTMESYRNIMVKYGDGGKRVWPTEFGWATVEGLGVGPAAGYSYAADNSEAEQAQFLVRAYQMGKSWGWVGPMFLWNLNFAPVAGKADEKAAFGIVRHDWGARPAYAALRDMGK